MIVSIVIDPNCFDSSSLKTDINYSQAITLLIGLKTNGVMLVDPQKIIIKELNNKITDLSIKQRQRLRIRLEEILKNKKQYLVIADSDPKLSKIKDPSMLATALAETLGADALIAERNNVSSLKENSQQYETVALSNFTFSKVEKKRSRYAQELPPIHTLKTDEVNQIFIDIVKYARWLRIYDKHIGKHIGENRSINDFRKGIEYILNLWAKHGCFFDQAQRLEIITQAKNPIKTEDDDFVRDRKDQENQEAVQGIQEDLIQPIREKFPTLNTELVINQDAEIRFHSRHIQTNNVIVLVEAGFDLFKAGKNPRKFRDNTLKLDQGGSLYLREIRKGKTFSGN